VNFEQWFSEKTPEIGLRSALAVIRLSDEGATLPFIARYRKENTGNLDEVGIQTVLTARDEWDQILKRQSYILGEIESQGKLTPELRDLITKSYDLDRLEDIYLPYKKKKKSKALQAKEAGLEPLADWIWNCGHGTEQPQPGQTLEIWAFTFRNEEKGYTDVPAVVQGAQDILVERLSEMGELRQKVREKVFASGCIRAQKGEKPKEHSKFENYFDYREPITSLILPQNSHRYLALRRGMIEQELSLATEGPADDATWSEQMGKLFEEAACTVPDSPGAANLKKAAHIAFKAHVFPAIEREAHRKLKEIADQAALRVFSENLKRLLLAPPLGSKHVMGIDPGIRTGCKIAIVDASGKYVGSSLIHLQTDDAKAESKRILGELLNQFPIEAIAVGNGTAGRETELFVRATLKENGKSIPVAAVNEAGASIYSASEIAREEFPDLDVTIRGAISIARRLQDPLAELVKLDPKSIGVGQYQHDVAPALMKSGLDVVVETCVNSVGVDLNTASAPLLSRVAGIGPQLSQAVVAKRASAGLFSSRADLLEVPGFGQKAFEQAAGFLRVRGSKHPLDNTGVHPERYALIEGVATRLNKKVEELLGSGVSVLKSDKELESQVGPFTFQDIVRDLEKPGRDPRGDFVPLQFRAAV
jgi:protein Tex